MQTDPRYSYGGSLPSYSEIEINTDKLATIPERCFYGQSESALDFSKTKNLKEIKKKAFEGNRWLNSVEIPDGVESLEDKAFNKCDSLTDISIPNSVKAYGNNVFYVDDYLATSVDTDNELMAMYDESEPDFTAESFYTENGEVPYPWALDNRQEFDGGAYFKLVEGTKTAKNIDPSDVVLKLYFHKRTSRGYVDYGTSLEYTCSAVGENGVYFIPVSMDNVYVGYESSHGTETLAFADLYVKDQVIALYGDRDNTDGVAGHHTSEGVYFSYETYNEKNGVYAGNNLSIADGLYLSEQDEQKIRYGYGKKTTTFLAKGACTIEDAKNFDAVGYTNFAPNPNQNDYGTLYTMPYNYRNCVYMPVFLSGNIKVNY